MGPGVLSLGNITVFVIEGERKTKRDVLREKITIVSLFTFFVCLISIVLTVFYKFVETLNVDDILQHLCFKYINKAILAML